MLGINSATISCNETIGKDHSLIPEKKYILVDKIITFPEMHKSTHVLVAMKSCKMDVYSILY